MALCDIFMENKAVLKNTFKWHDAELYSACAAIFIDQRKIADKEKLLEMKTLLKSRFGIFSDYRGNAEMAILSCAGKEEQQVSIYEGKRQAQTD